ncbi:MAG: c-type cytochrome domain-containing protein, partial [Longimicrobiales bacterium]
MKPFVVTSAVLGMSLMLIGEITVPDSTRTDFDPVAHTAVSDVDPNEIVSRTCVRCHSDSRLRGNLSLEDFDIGRAGENAETIERMIRKVRAGMMPPPGTRAPEGDTLAQFAQTLEDIMDESAARNPNPGRRTFQRLNRPEFEQAIRDLLDLEVRAD